MIKKSGAFLLALLYCVTVTGFALNLHYCGKLLASVTFNASAKGCGMRAAKAMTCCKDKTIHVKVKDVHQSGAASSFSKAPAYSIVRAAFVTSDLLNGRSLNGSALCLRFANAPPRSTPVYLKNRTFRI